MNKEIRLFIGQPHLDVKGYPISNSILLALIQQATWTSLTYNSETDIKRNIINIVMDYIHYYINKNYYYEDLIVRLLDKILREIVVEVVSTIIDNEYYLSYQMKEARLITGGVVITLEERKLYALANRTI